MTFHRCRHPLWHRLGIGLVVALWIAVGACWLVPHCLYGVTQSGALALAGVGLGMCVGTPLVWALVAWRCHRSRSLPAWSSGTLPLAALAWHLRER